ncbi:MAG TPA: hypothetical protein VG097_09765 [Gemmata sp.]|jgi:hypothetical protein|nr:hypothetical protein [Gemmata sp.]
MSWISATLSKAGNGPEENEDAIAASPTKARFAVADGATEGWESAKWAGHIATAYIEKPPSPANFDAWLADVRKGWKIPPQAVTAPWYAEMKQEAGSYSTLLGIEFRIAADSHSWTWKAIAIGDSCLFQIRAGRVNGVYPISTPAGFGNNPPLLPSPETSVCPEPEWLAGRSEPKDLFILATDAVAAYLVGRKKPDSWSPVLLAVQEGLRHRTPEPLLKWFPTVQAVRNDDLSLVAVLIPAVPEATA